MPASTERVSWCENLHAHELRAQQLELEPALQIMSEVSALNTSLYCIMQTRMYSSIQAKLTCVQLCVQLT
eukprot:1160766-Pelagomonas_calceolata.AAC.11